MGFFRQDLALMCEAAGTGAAMLLLPAAVVDVVFGTDLLDVLSPVALLVLAIATIVIVAARASATPGSD